MRRGSIPVLRVYSRPEGEMKIRITAAGVGVVIVGRSDHPEGAVLTVSLRDGDYFIRHGFGELVTDEPTLPEEAAGDDRRQS